MNNKYLAVSLVIIAIFAVTYQVFFRKSEVIKSQPAVSGIVRGADSGRSGAGDLFTFIDVNSSDLLNSVLKSDSSLPYERRSVDSMFGREIFADQHKKESVQGRTSAGGAKEISFYLQGTVIDRKVKKAIINNLILMEGERIGNALILKIERGRVTIDYENRNIVLEIRKKVNVYAAEGGKRDI